MWTCHDFSFHFVNDTRSKFGAYEMFPITALVYIPGWFKDKISLSICWNLFTQSFREMFDVVGGSAYHTIILFENPDFGKLIVVQKSVHKLSICLLHFMADAICTWGRHCSEAACGKIRRWYEAYNFIHLFLVILRSQKDYNKIKSLFRLWEIVERRCAQGRIGPKLLF